jgi:hypothetical protein
MTSDPNPMAASSLTRRTALTHAAAGSIAAIVLSNARVSAQESTPGQGVEALTALQLARRAGDVRSGLAPVIVAIRTESSEELADSAKEYLDQLKEQQDVTDEEATSLQEILDAAGGDEDDQTKIDKIQATVDKIKGEGEDASPSALAIAAIALAIVRREERSASGEPATPEGDEDADFWERVKRGIVGAIAGAAVGGAIAEENGTVIGAIAGGLAAAI